MMNQLPKDVIINKIIPYIESDKNKEIAQLKEIIEGMKINSILVDNCSSCTRKIIIDIDIDEEISYPVKYSPSLKYAVVICGCRQSCIYCAVDKNIHLLDTCPDCDESIEIHPAKNIILFFSFLFF